MRVQQALAGTPPELAATFTNGPERSREQRLDRSATGLRRLFVLRNFLLLAVLVVLLLSHHLLNISLPVLPLALVLAGIALLNLVTWLWLRSTWPISERTLFMQLVLDVLAFTLLLYFSGGASNPFGWFYLVLVFFAATALPTSSTWLVTLLAVVGYSIVMFYYQPLSPIADQHAHHQGHDGFQMHVMGMWLGFVVTAVLVAYVLGRLTSSLRLREQRLAAAREQALRDEKLVALGTLAAGAAHELGTPLATIAVLARELELDLGEQCDPQVRDRLKILRSQVARCKQAISVISGAAGAQQALEGSLKSATVYLDGVISTWRSQRPTVPLDTEFQLGAAEGSLLAEETLTQALHSVLNNAADASPQGVQLRVVQQDRSLVIEVRDEGQGLDAAVARHAGRAQFSTKEHGMGLGLFLAHAAIQRLGGSIVLYNRDGGGACTRITLPLAASGRDLKP